MIIPMVEREFKSENVRSFLILTVYESKTWIVIASPLLEIIWIIYSPLIKGQK